MSKHRPCNTFVNLFKNFSSKANVKFNHNYIPKNIYKASCISIIIDADDGLGVQIRLAVSIFNKQLCPAVRSCSSSLKCFDWDHTSSSSLPLLHEIGDSSFIPSPSSCSWFTEDCSPSWRAVQCLFRESFFIHCVQMVWQRVLYSSILSVIGSRF